MASRLNQVLCISKDDAKRFKRIGVPEERILVSGNIKYDLTLNEERFGRSHTFRKKNLRGPVLGAISTHDGEEVLMLQAFLKLREDIQNLSLVLVPRHRSGVELAEKWLKENGHSYTLRADKDGKMEDFSGQVLLGATMGEIELYFGLCDLVFMGGSFVKTGGHNPLEPAYFSLPVITGPNYQNFKEPFDRLIDTQGAFVADDLESFCHLTAKLLGNAQELKAAGLNALAVQQQGGGALMRTLKEMEKSLPCC